MDFIEVNGVSLRYELGGAGEELVVLVHELGGIAESWDDALPLFGREFRTLRYDQRGCGLSEKIRATPRLDDMTGDLSALLDALGIRERVHLTGVAVGGGLSLAFATRFPERVARVAVGAPATGATPEWRGKLLARADEIERDGVRVQVRESLDRSYPEVIRARDRARFERYKNRWLSNDPASFAAINRMMAEVNMIPSLANIRAPVLTMAGVHDPIRPPEIVKKTAAAIPGAIYRDVDSWHFMHLQTPELYAANVIAFLLGR